MFVERVWRSVKYEEVYLKAYESVSHARRSIGDESICTTRDDLTRVWKTARRMRHTSRRCLRLNRQHERPVVPLKNLVTLSEQATPPLKVALLVFAEFLYRYFHSEENKELCWLKARETFHFCRVELKHSDLGLVDAGTGG